jgi:predicted Fe-S protein YdhL (DUF1289 family)
VTASPCIGFCRLFYGVCEGCHRTAAEIACWRDMNEGERQTVLTQVLTRKSKAVSSTLPLAGEVSADV